MTNKQNYIFWAPKCYIAGENKSINICVLVSILIKIVFKFYLTPPAQYITFKCLQLYKLKGLFFIF